MNEKDASIVVVTETWLRKDCDLCQGPLELRETEDLNIMTRCREAAANGVAYGGVAIVWRERDCSFKEVNVSNVDGYEVLVGAGSLPGHTRKIVLVACYIPPNYCRSRGEAASDYITDVLIGMKR